MEVEASPARGSVIGMRQAFGAEHDGVPPADGEATAGCDIPDRCSSPALQLALSAGSSRADGAVSASLQLPLLASMSRQTPTLHGAARELSPLADVPDALSLGLSAVSAGQAAPAEAVSGDTPTGSTAGAGCAPPGDEGARVLSCRKGRSEAGERHDGYMEAPRSQTQLSLGEHEVDQRTPAASEGGRQASAASDVVPLQGPPARAPLLESGPVLHTQLGAAQAGVAAAEAGGGAPAPAVNTQAEAAASALPAGSLHLVPDSEDPVTGWQHRPAAPPAGPANGQPRSPGACLTPAVAADSSSRGETGGRSGGAGSSGAPGAICANDAPLDSLRLPPVLDTQRGGVSKPACAEAAPSAQRPVSGPAPTTGEASKDDSAPADSSGALQAEPAPQPDSMGDKTTEVTTSPAKLPRSFSTYGEQEALVRPDMAGETHAQHAGDAREAAADAAEPLQPAAQCSAAMAQAVRDSDVGGHPCASQMDAAGSAAVADDAVDASISAPVPDSQPAEGGAGENLGLPSLPRQVPICLANAGTTSW